MKPITVIDSVMGAGKTTYAIEMINKAPETERFIYITPFLAEIERVIGAVKSRKFVQPNLKDGKGSKLTSLKNMVIRGQDIAATHALFEMADDELIWMLRENNYTLVLDEVMNIIDRADVSPYDMQIAMNSKFISVENNVVKWLATPEQYAYGKLDDIRKMSEAGTLFYHRNKYLVYAFPPSIFSAFNNVYVLTYLFEAQLMRSYMNLYKIPYELKAVQDGVIVEYDTQREGREELFALINLYEGTHNKHGAVRTAFSTTWLNGLSSEENDAISASMYSYVRKVTKSKANEVLWTTIKDKRNALKGKGYSKGFLACNARATNEYADRSTVMYMYNRFMNPVEKSFFQDNGVTVDEERLALSDMLQWLWRSQIRTGKQINAYIPSSRMRQILRDWSEYKL